MKVRHHRRLIRHGFLLCTTILLCLWIIPLLKSYFIDTIEDYDQIEDNHIYPPPWYVSNWTINDYLKRKDRFKTMEEQDAIDNHQKIFLDYDPPKQQKSTYLILEYTKVIGRPKFCGKTDDFIFGKQCPYRNCRYTCEQNASNIADVWLMHRSDIDFHRLPKERNFDQIWLFWHDEPCGVQKEAIPFQYNWTISYRVDTEANLGAYGLTVLRKNFLSHSQLNSYINEQFKHRQGNAVWFVSNCGPKARLNYYRELVKYYPSIKVYGNCVEQKAKESCGRQSQCESSELQTNQFYLAFESQTCRDYITEKFWRSIVHGVIPIVFGPREKQSLERIAPPNSFIYTGDFSSAEKLAEHMKEINRDRVLFGKYHRWRRFYQVLYRPEDIESYRFCEVCYRLNTHQKKSYYRDINQFFLKDC